MYRCICWVGCFSIGSRLFVTIRKDSGDCRDAWFNKGKISVHAKTLGPSRSLVATFIAVLLTVAGVATPARATTADAPTSVPVSQSGLVVSAAVTVPEGETVGTVTVAVGSDSPVSVHEVTGEYPVTLTRADFGKSIVFSATALADGLD